MMACKEASNANQTGFQEKSVLRKDKFTNWRYYLLLIVNRADLSLDWIYKSALETL
jgi:hypothetical protein